MRHCPLNSLIGVLLFFSPLKTTHILPGHHFVGNQRVWTYGCSCMSSESAAEIRGFGCLHQEIQNAKEVPIMKAAQSEECMRRLAGSSLVCTVNICEMNMKLWLHTATNISLYFNLRAGGSCSWMFRSTTPSYVCYVYCITVLDSKPNQASKCFHKLFH